MPGAILAIVAWGTPAAADPEPLKPAVTRSGWQVDLSGYVQADSIPWAQDSIDELDPSTGEPLNQQRFLIRRGRLRADAHRGNLSGALELDGNTVTSATARVLAAYAGYAFPSSRAPIVSVFAGLFKTPFGVEVPASERDKPFVEPPAFARGLFPGSYDAGVMVGGGYGWARWALAMVNGAPAGDAQWHGRDPSASYDLVGRVGAEVAGPDAFRIEGGVSALRGRGLHPGTPPTKETLQWVDANQDGIVNDITELQVLPGSPGTPSQGFDHRALGADVQAHWLICGIGDGTAFFEGVLATNLDRGIVYADPIAVSRDVRQLGFALGVVQDLGAYAQAGVRYDRYDADRDASEREGVALVGTHKVFSTLGVIAAARWNDARITVEYDHERNPFGRGDDGMPITRSADRVTVRAQVGF